LWDGLFAHAGRFGKEWLSDNKSNFRKNGKTGAGFYCCSQNFLRLRIENFEPAMKKAGDYSTGSLGQK
jgi:hypothetical protein